MKNENFLQPLNLKGNIMRKILLLILLFCLSIVLFSCKKEVMPIPNFPLDKETIADALNQWDFAYILEEETENPHNLIGFSQFYINDPDNQTNILGLNSSVKGADRIVNASFIAFNNTIQGEDIEKAIVFMTRLFGGFNNDHTVYDQFVKEYNHKNTTIKETSNFSGKIKSRSMWESQVQGMTVQIQLEQPSEEGLPEYLLTISISTNRDVFLEK